MDDIGRSAGGQLGDYTYPTDMSERSFGEIVKSIIGNLQEIVRAEVRLARTEIREEGGKAAESGKHLGMGAVAGLFSGLFLLNAVMYGLSGWMPLWAAALVVSAVLGIAAMMLLSKGREEWKKFSPKPEKTVETVKENVEWIKTQTKS